MPTPACTRDIVDYATAVTPILIAAYAVWIATQQWKASREKLRLDLYDRRFHIYESTLIFYQAMAQAKEYLESLEFKEKLSDFIRSCRESRFLFDEASGITKRLEELQAQSFKIIGFKQHGHELASDPATQIRLAGEMQETFRLFEASMLEMEQAMGKYLNFHRVVA